MKQPTARPFLRWVGGKTTSLRRLLPEAQREPFGSYHEPFLGGGALFFALQPKHAVLSDSCERLIRTWRAVRDRVGTVVDQLAWMETRFKARGETFYYQQREREVDHLLDVDVAAWMIFLNKTCFNGLYRVNKSGKANMPVGKKSSGELNTQIVDQENLLACSVALQGTDLHCRDFGATTVAARPGDLVYCDPPYVSVDDTSFNKYTPHGFTPKDQVRLRDMALSLKSTGVRVLLSNSSSVEAERLYGGQFEIEELHVRRSVNADASGRGRVGEYLIK